MSEIIQYDTSDIVVGEVNIAAAIQTDKKIVFNKSFTITGRKLSAQSIYACYDLTVIGNLDADEIEVAGKLYVIGNINAKQLSCHDTIVCSGDITADIIDCSEIVANNIDCASIICTGNIVLRSTINVNKTLRSERSVIAGEGILGNGHFSAKNAIATEYFNFDGEVLGKVIELDTDATFGEPHKLPSTNKFMLSDWNLLIKNISDISSLDRVTNLREYLIIILVTKLIPKETIENESIKDTLERLLSEAEKELDTLSFRAKNVEDFALALKIVMLCSDELKIGKDEALDRIFQSIGIKYKTLKPYMG